MDEINVNEEQLAFYLELGRAISQFKQVTDGLYWVLEVTVNCTEPDAYRNELHKFVRARTFGNQLRIAANVLPRLLPEEFRSGWGQLETRLRDARDKRNDLAHCWIMSNVRNPPGKRYMLLPLSAYKYDPSKHLEDHAIFLLDVVRYRHAFFSVGRKLENLDWRLRGNPSNYSTGEFPELKEPDLLEVIRGPYVYLGLKRPSR